MTNIDGDRKARVVGRILRLLLGLVLTWMTYDVMSVEDTSFNMRVLLAMAGLIIFYGLMHQVVSNRFRNLNPWIGALIAVTPAVLVYVLGGPVGRVSSVAFIGVSLILQAVRADGGCEVMSIPAILFGKRTHLVCIAFSPIDWIEERLAKGRVR